MNFQSLVLKTVLLGAIFTSPSFARDIPAVTFYSSDTNHLWNRLYAHLCVRVANDGEVYADLLDPPFWSRTKYLLSGEANRRARVFLQEFTSDTKLRDAMPPLRRAMMQRDLIAVFCWLTGNRAGDDRPSPDEQALAFSLARAIHHIALSATEIQQLPGNYAAAVALKNVPSEFDPERPHVAFLPADLLDDAGPWLLLAPKGDDLMPATRHFETFKGRSAFEVRFRHAEGRASGQNYLRQLAEMPTPLVTEKPLRLVARPAFANGPWINPNTPQFPLNSSWALIRRAVLLDNRGLPVVSPLVESVQLRAYRSLERDPTQAQSAFEWELRRALLFRTSGMHEARPGENHFPHFMGKGFDPFEENWRIRENPTPQRLGCFQCHSGAGIHSVNSRTRFFEPTVNLPVFEIVSSARFAQITERNSRLLPEWTLLRWLKEPAAQSVR